MQLRQYGNLTPQNVICYEPSDDLEHIKLWSIILKKEELTQEIPKRFHLLAALVISEAWPVSGGEWEQGKVRGRTRIEFLSFESFPMQFSF